MAIISWVQLEYSSHWSTGYVARSTSLCACLFELQLNEKQLELVGSEKQLKLDSW
jgi:hypothetical protein